MDILLGIAIALIAVALTNLIKNKKSSSQAATDPEPSIDYQNSYQAKLILTKNEWYEYRKLRDLAAPHGLYICPKVRLLDIVEPRRGEDYMSLLGKIQSKHVDFVITDKDLRIKAILELDDGSHDREDRKERDHFVDEILTGVGYTVIRTRSITDNTLDPIIRTTQ